MKINIRRVAPHDVSALSAIARQTFFDTFTGTCSEDDMQSFLNEYYSEAQLRSELMDADTFCFFAEVDAVPVAYLQFREDYKNFPVEKKWKALELKRIYVLTAFQGLGIAQKLMDHILEFAKNEQYEMVWLGVWENNFRAQRFYEKYGFKNSGYTHDFPIGNTPQTDVWLWKFLKQ
ncbi:MAG: GNAT family N-acetyltransferase [Chitinophagaceae bacterium]|nr:GNAT family N-acetyltransferase [Chitinophagaceae bacterium]